VETREDVFGLDEQARHYVDEKIGHLGEPELRKQILVDEIIRQATQKLSYESDADTTASQTFRNQTANCLSMSIMAYAMAKYLGFETGFQLVDIPEYWERRDHHSLVARHVNVLLKPEPTLAGLNFGDTVEIDFFAPGSSREFGSRAISASTVLAMFYNNKAVAALIGDNRDAAYAYLRAALMEDPGLTMALGNLALLYAREGRLQWAEQAYREAARRDPDDTVSREGLAMVLKLTGRRAQADAILAKLAHERRDNPFFYYVQGEEAYDAGDWDQAIRSFRKAIHLRPDLDRPYFGLAKTYFRMGERDNAKAYLRRAEHHADTYEGKRRYRNKIAALSGL
ncbi:MAG TPA: tetratricopeptide repeat protein, partial [Gammaproteobacteria bacterium]